MWVRQKPRLALYIHSDCFMQLFDIVMKKALLVIIFSFVGIFACHAVDVDLFEGSVTLNGVSVEKSKTKLILSMDVNVLKIRQSGNSEMVFVPVLNGADGKSYRFPELIVSGRNRYFYRLRNGEAALSLDRLYRSDRVKMIHYESVIAYEPWMEVSDLSIDYVQSDCGCDMPFESVPLLKLDYKPRVFSPEYVFISPEAEVIKGRDLKGSAYIDFPVNRTELYPDYRRNPEELAKIRKTIDVVRNDSNVTITDFYIKGYASPEGSYENNVRLAKGRTETLKDYVQGLYSFDPAIMRSSYEPEDWDGLRRYVESSDIENKEGILAIIDSDLAPDPKNEKIKATYPRQYAFLLKEEYPALRHSDYTINYVVRSFTSVDEIKEVLMTAPQNLSLNELFLVALSYEPGSEDYCNVFETAVRMFPNDAIANLNAANIALQHGDLSRARKYASKAGEIPEAIYLRGLIEAKDANNEKAMGYFEKAAVMGLKQATDALKQLQEVLE